MGNPLVDSIRYYLTEESLVFSLIEAIWQLTGPFAYPPSPSDYRIDSRAQFAADIRAILSDHRVAFDFVEGRFIPRSNQVLHKDVVLPTLTLLSGREGLRDR